jgi:hypothetical protein
MDVGSDAAEIVEALEARGAIVLDAEAHGAGVRLHLLWGPLAFALALLFCSGPARTPACSTADWRQQLPPRERPWPAVYPQETIRRTV